MSDWNAGWCFTLFHHFKKSKLFQIYTAKRWLMQRHIGRTLIPNGGLWWFVLQCGIDKPVIFSDPNLVWNSNRVSEFAFWKTNQLGSNEALSLQLWEQDLLCLSQNICFDSGPYTEAQNTCVLVFACLLADHCGMISYFRKEKEHVVFQYYLPLSFSSICKNVFKNICFGTGIVLSCFLQNWIFLWWQKWN